MRSLYKTKDVELLNLTSLTYGKTFEDFKEERALSTMDLNDYKENIQLKSNNLFINYKENDLIVFPKLLNDWIFLKSAKGKEAYFLKYDMIDNIKYKLELLTNVSNLESERGFFGAAFKNDKTKEIVIVFRGTDDFIDVCSDIKLGLFKSFSRQILEASEFFKYIQTVYNSKMEYKIIVTGHSLGGYLAQFVYAINSISNQMLCLTFNGLGLGNEDSDVESLIRGAIKMSAGALDINLLNDLVRSIKDSFILSDHQISSSVLYMEEDSKKTISNIYTKVISNYNGIHNVIQKESGIFKNLKYAFGFGQEKEKNCNIDICINPYIINEILDILQTIFKYQQYYYNIIKKEKEDTNCINYIFPNDFTANARKHIGIINNITTKSNPITCYKYKYNTLLKSNILTHHSLCNFILYIYNSGYFTPGLIRYAFLSNIFLMYIYPNLEKLKLLSKENLDIELIKLQSELQKDEKFIFQFYFNEYYLKGIKNITPYYQQKNNYIFGIKQNIIFDNIKSSNSVVIKLKEKDI